MFVLQYKNNTKKFEIPMAQKIKKCSKEGKSVTPT